MSFASGAGNWAVPEKKLAGLDKSRVSTAEQGIQLPLFWGVKVCGLIFCSNAFNQRYVVIEQDAKKAMVASGVDKYCSFAALVCHGPVDCIYGIRIDDELVWTPTNGSLSKGSAEFETITISEGRNIRLYWGSETQTIDPLLLRLSADTSPNRNPLGLQNADNEYEEHPAYRGQCYIVAEDFFIGYNASNVPTIELILGRRPALPISWSGWPLDVGRDYNPMAVVVDVITNKRYGLGLTDTSSVFDRTAITATAVALKEEGCALSPYVDRAQPAQDFMVELLSYFDAYYRTDELGRITAGLIRKVPCNDPLSQSNTDGVAIIDESCLTDLPDITVGSLENAVNEVAVTFTDDENSYLENSVKADAPGNIAAGGTPKQEILQRPWITSAAMADRVARAAAHSMSLPEITGTLKVRKSKLQGIKAGSPFYFCYAHYGICWLHCRALDVNVADPFKPEVEIVFEFDRCQSYAGAYTPSTNVVFDKVRPSILPVEQFRIIELPYYRFGGVLNIPPGTAIVSVLAERPTAMTTQMSLLEDQSVPGDTFPFYVRNSKLMPRWACRGETVLSSSIQPDDSPSTIDCIFHSEFYDIPTEIGADPGDNEFKWLLLIRNEFWKVTDISAAGDPLTHTLTVSRQGLDTLMYSSKTLGPLDNNDVGIITTGEECWLCRWEDIQSNAVPLRDIKRDVGDDIILKIIPIVQSQYLDPETVSATVLTFLDRTRRPWAPKSAGASISSFSTFPSSITVSWTKANKEGGRSFVPAWDGVMWIVDVRPYGNAFVYDDTTAWRSGTHYEKAVDGNTGSLVITKTQIETAIGTITGSLTVRVFAMQGGVKSLYYHEETITKV